MSEKLTTIDFHGSAQELMSRAQSAARDYAAAEERRRDDLDRLIGMLRAVTDERDRLLSRAENAESRATIAESALASTSERYTNLLQEHRRLAGAFDMFVEVIGRRSGDILKEDLGVESAVLLAKARETFGVERPAESAGLPPSIGIPDGIGVRIPGSVDLARSSVTTVAVHAEHDEEADIRGVVAQFGRMFEQPQAAAAQ